MPIRLNLLSEAHELEDLRRRDPVKRAIYMACAVVVLVMVWSASKQVLILATKSRLSSLEARIEQRSGEHKKVLASQQQLVEVRAKLAALDQLSTNRLLNGNILNTLQLMAAEDIQLTHLKVEQSYSFAEAVKGSRNETTGRIIPGKPATATERIIFTIDARDNSLRPGEEQLNNWRQGLGDAAFFHDLLSKSGEFRLTSRSTPLYSPGSEKPFVSFTLEGRVPDRMR